jgi:hypothetical protein
VLVTGGTDGGELIGPAEWYDPATGTWSEAGTLVGPRLFHSVAPLQNGGALVTGGSMGAFAEVLDPQTRTWSDAGPC